jgi:hypothetical protein
VHLQVDARAVHGVAAGAWPRRRLLARTEVPLAEGANDGSTGEPHALRAGVNRALDELARAAPLKHAAIDIELGDSLLHFDVAHGSFGGKSTQQLDSIARVCARELLGDSAEGHELRWDLQADEKHLWICTVPLQLLSDLREAVSQRGLRLQGLKPAFAASWNRHRQALKPGLGVFASVRGDFSVVAFARDGVVEALSADRFVTEPAPAAEARAADKSLDLQVLRLVTSLGVDTRAVKQFVALAEAPVLSRLGPHWQRIDAGRAVA